MTRKKVVLVALLLNMLLGMPLAVNSSSEETKPELHPSSLVLVPSSPVALGSASSSVTVSTVIENSGDADAGTLTILFAHRKIKDALGNPVEGQTFLTSAFGNGGKVLLDELPQGAKSAALSLSLDILKLAGQGTYEIRVLVDPNNEISELDENNNALATELTVLPIEKPAAPELHPESLRLDPARPVQQGDVVKITATLANTGGVQAQGFSVSFSYRPQGQLLWQPLKCVPHDSACEDLSLPAAAGATKIELAAELLTTLGLAPGIYEIRVIVDPDSKIKELDEDNNELVTTITIFKLRRPDLQFSSPLELRLGEVNLQSQPLMPGQPVGASIKVQNVGDKVAEAEEFSIRFNMQPTPCVQPCPVVPARLIQPDGKIDASGKQGLPRLGIGEGITVSALLDTSQLQPATYSVDATIVKSAGEDSTAQSALESAQFTIGGPELVVRSLSVELRNPNANDVFSFEDQITQGGLIKASVEIANEGIIAAGAFKVEFQLQGLEAGTTFVSHLSDVVPGLGMGGTQPLTVKVETTFNSGQPELTPGLYQLQAIVDSGNQVAEQNEGNNIRPANFPIRVHARPDLLVSQDGIFLNRLGDVNMRASALIRNEGLGPAFTPFNVRFSYRRADLGFPVAFAIAVFDDPSRKLSPQGAQLVSADLNVQDAPLQPPDVSGNAPRGPLPAGSYQICITVDPENRSLESDSTRGNNEKCSEPFEIPLSGVSVQPQPPATGGLPDLVPLGLFLTQQGIPVEEIRQGESVKISVMVQNLGGTKAGSFRVDFCYILSGRIDCDAANTFASLNLTQIGKDRLDPNETATFNTELSAAITANLNPGDYEILVIVDPPFRDHPNGVVTESNEANNRIKAPLTIKRR